LKQVGRNTVGSEKRKVLLPYEENRQVIQGSSGKKKQSEQIRTEPVPSREKGTPNSDKRAASRKKNPNSIQLAKTAYAVHMRREKEWFHPPRATQ